MMDYLNEGVNRREKNSVEPITSIIHVNYREPKNKSSAPERKVAKWNSRHDSN